MTGQELSTLRIGRRRMLAGGAAAGAAVLTSRATTVEAVVVPQFVSALSGWLDVTTITVNGTPFPSGPGTAGWNDVSPWINAAIAQANPGANGAWALEGGGVVYVPAGRYYLGAPIQMRLGVELRGDGPATQLIAATNLPSLISVTSNTTRVWIHDLRLRPGGDEGGTVRVSSGIKFSVETDPAVPAANRQPAWWTQGETPHVVQDVWIEGNTGIGVHIEEGSNGVVLDAVHVVAHPTSPGSAGFRVNSNGNSVTACSSDGHGSNGFAVVGSRNRLDTCRAIRNATNGYSIAGSENGLSGCVARGPAGNGIRVTGQRTVLNGCVAVGFTQAGTNAGLLIESGAQHLSVPAINASANFIGISATSPDHVFMAGIVAGNGTQLHNHAAWFDPALLVP